MIFTWFWLNFGTHFHEFFDADFRTAFRWRFFSILIPKWLPKWPKNASIELPRASNPKGVKIQHFSPKSCFGSHLLDLVIYGRRVGTIFTDFVSILCEFWAPFSWIWDLFCRTLDENELTCLIHIRWAVHGAALILIDLYA